mmetsp:Transcript_23274/g.26972  ORF Transcript_23274/g.26972 Transcript_23274/m.26972 type:complete len:115 (+) Transcript_23274:29-373(+)
MAPPPKYLITRRLIKQFFKGFLPKRPIEAGATDYSDLVECWGKFGVDSPKCFDILHMMDDAEKQTKDYTKKLRALKFEQTVTSKLNKPVYKSMVKGKHATNKPIRHESIYDGVY